MWILNVAHCGCLRIFHNTACVIVNLGGYLSSAYSSVDRPQISSSLCTNSVVFELELRYSCVKDALWLVGDWLQWTRPGGGQQWWRWDGWWRWTADRRRCSLCARSSGWRRRSADAETSSQLLAPSAVDQLTWSKVNADLYGAFLKCSGVLPVNEGWHSFTWHSHVHLQLEWTFTLQSHSITALHQCSFLAPLRIGGWVVLGGRFSNGGWVCLRGHTYGLMLLRCFVHLSGMSELKVHQENIECTLGFFSSSSFLRVLRLGANPPQCIFWGW